MCTSLGLTAKSVFLFIIYFMFTEGSVLLQNYPKKELWPYYQIKCDLKCKYGYKTDMEGRYFCKCYNPCENIYCHSGTICVIDLPKSTDCDWQSCRAKAYCQEYGAKPKKKNRRKIYLILDSQLQRDDAGSEVNSGKKEVDVCNIPLGEEAKQCSKLRRRWYFDPVSGQCRKFRGCRTGGNNFGRKKRCKRKCLRKSRMNKRKNRRARKFRRIRG